MKIRGQILSVVMAGATLLGGGQVYADDTVIVPQDATPGEIKILKIDPAANEITLAYYDTGVDVDLPNRLVLSWPKDDRELDLELMGTSSPPWMREIYDKSVYQENAIQLVSGVEYTLSSEMMSAGVDLLENEQGKLFYGASMTVQGTDIVRRIVGLIDYSRCMKVYEAGVTCELDAETGGYEPWLDGVKLEVPDDEEDNTGGDGTGEENTDGNDDVGEENNTGDVGDVSDVVDDYWSGASDSAAGNMPSGEAGVTLASVNPADARAFYGAMGNERFALDDEMTNEQANGEAVDVVSEGKVSGDSSEIAVPELGDESGATGRRMKWWMFVPVGVATLGILAWWLIPVFKRRKEEEEE